MITRETGIVLFVGGFQLSWENLFGCVINISQNIPINWDEIHYNEQIDQNDFGTLVVALIIKFGSLSNESILKVISGHRLPRIPNISTLI